MVIVLLVIAILRGFACRRKVDDQEYHHSRGSCKPVFLVMVIDFFLFRYDQEGTGKISKEHVKSLFHAHFPNAKAELAVEASEMIASADANKDSTRDKPDHCKPDHRVDQKRFPCRELERRSPSKVAGGVGGGGPPPIAAASDL